jgi:hypothetical protein
LLIYFNKRAKYACPLKKLFEQLLQMSMPCGRLREKPVYGPRKRKYHICRSVRAFRAGEHVRGLKKTAWIPAKTMLEWRIIAHFRHLSHEIGVCESMHE